MEQTKSIFIRKKYRSVMLASLVIETVAYLVSLTDTLVAGSLISKEALTAIGIIAPLRPVYDVYPVHMTDAEREEFKREVSGALKAAGVSLDYYDVEGFFTEEGRFFTVEINARMSGYSNPQQIELATGVNLTKLLIQTAFGERTYYEELKTFRRSSRHILTIAVFSRKEGDLDHIYIDPLLLTHLKAVESMYKLPRGGHVQDNLRAKWPIVMLAFEFADAEELEEARQQIEETVRVVLL